MLRSTSIIPSKGASDFIALNYGARILRRKRLVSDAGVEFLVDLAETRSLNDGDGFALEDGTVVAVRAAPEDLLEVTGAQLHRIAWHIGNRHTPCQIEDTRLLIQRDHVMAEMLAQLGAHVHEVVEPFTPEGGAYGHGRTFGHNHGDGEHHHHD